MLFIRAKINNEKNEIEKENIKEKFVNDHPISKYINNKDWMVKENSNMPFALQGLNYYLYSEVVRNFWLDHILTPEMAEAHRSGDLHIHDLGALAPYCCGWDLYQFIKEGLRSSDTTRIVSSPPKHLSSALDQLMNLFFLLQQESAGAQAVSSFDVLLAPFVRHDNLDYHQVKQHLQRFVYNLNEGMRTGGQAPFTNITLDLKASESAYADQPVIIGGEETGEYYREFQKETDMINEALFDIYMEGDANGRIFTFPIPTVNITDDFDWDSPIVGKMMKLTAKYGPFYFNNFISTGRKPTEVRSMCCRLNLDLTELKERGGGLFGANPKTGSVSVTTINMPRIAIEARNKREFFEILGKRMELAKEISEIRRETVEYLTEIGLYPYIKYYMEDIKIAKGGYYANHFSTIGLVGMNEACEIFLDKDLTHEEAIDFAEEVMIFMREKLKEFQKETGHYYNLEATPAESVSYRLPLLDMKKYGVSYEYYNNSTHLPVDATTNPIEYLEKQWRLESLYTGGSVIHFYLGEVIKEVESLKSFIKKVFENYPVPYISITPTFSICPNCGYIEGEKYECPKCGSETEVYSRIVGYYRPVKNWNKGKQAEFKDRKVFKL